MANKHVTRCSALLVTRKSTANQMVTIKTEEVTGINKDVEKRGPLCTVGGNVN